VRVDHRSLKARGIDREPAPQIPHAILCIERGTGMPSKVGEALRASYRERVEARLKGPDELARVLQRQKEVARQGAIERARRTAALPKGTRSATYTAEERQEMRRELYRTNEALREKRRASNSAYYRKNAEVIKQKKREARLRAKPSPEQQSVQRWLKWRQRQEELTRQQTRAQEHARGREKQRGPAIAPTLTAKDSVRNWLAYRERQKQAELTQSAGQQRAHERAFGKSIADDDGRKKKNRTHSYDYGL
jgi:hypothetical protein